MENCNNYKCGEIYITYKGKYSYNCVVCHEWFDSVEYYEDHYMVQHFESKELYENDVANFPIKIEPMTQYDIESIKSEVNSENESLPDLIDSERYIRMNIIKGVQYQSINEDSDVQESDNAEVSEVIVTIKNTNEDNNAEILDLDLLEWNDSDQEISIDEIEIPENMQTNNENIDDNNLQIENQDVIDEYLTCEICLIKYISSSLLDHMFQHEESGICPLCKKGVDNLHKHSKTDHENFDDNEAHTKLKISKQAETRKRAEKRKSISCKYCNKNFFLTNALEQHEKLHENRRLNCEFCNKSYRDLRFLKYHMRKHTGERPFKCQNCPAAFTTKDNLNTHNIYKHTDTYNFSCTYSGCDRKFKTKELRKRHIKNIHLKVLGYQCDICGQKFMTSSRLSIHRVKSHVDPEEWPFKCEFCEKSFILPCKLKEHVNCHTGEKPFKCDLCEQRFMKRRSLNEHKKKHLKK